MKRSSLKKNDVIMTITGTVGIAAVIPEELGECNMSQEIVRIRIVDKDKVKPHYLAAYLNRPETKTLLKRWGSGSTRPRTLVRKVRQIPVLIPKDPEIQNTIVEKVKNLERVQKSIKKSFKDLTEATDILYS